VRGPGGCEPAAVVVGGPVQGRPRTAPAAAAAWSGRPPPAPPPVAAEAALNPGTVKRGSHPIVLAYHSPSQKRDFNHLQYHTGTEVRYR
jgi:hypothetical protein